MNDQPTTNTGTTVQCPAPGGSKPEPYLCQHSTSGHTQPHRHVTDGNDPPEQDNVPDEE